MDASLTADATEPQPAPERRLTPVAVLPKRAAERSRRATLVSPIPALMAASMRDPLDVANPAAPPVHQDQEALRFDSEEDAYVVEIDASKPEA